MMPAAMGSLLTSEIELDPDALGKRAAAYSDLLGHDDLAGLGLALELSGGG
jgi:hypothetical protein